MKMTFKVIVVGGVIVFFAVLTIAVFIPGLIWDPPQTTIAHLYTTQQQKGRVLFYSNGCNYCHTQYVRVEDTAMGPPSQGGNYVFDNPVILGSERTGPDLSYIGRKRSEAWEIEHLKDPRRFSPLSIMPSFEFFKDEELEAIAAYLFALGDRVAQARMITPPDAFAGVSDPRASVEVQPDSGNTPQGWATWQAAGLQEGKEHYISRCLTCHGCAGNGLGNYAGTMIVTPADFKQQPFRSMPDDQWFWHVSEGVPGTLMPTWKTSLSEDERWKVIRYVQQIFSRPVMRDPDEGDPPGNYADLTNPLPLTLDTIDEGKRIFIRECMVCHGDHGRGNGPYSAGLEPSPPDFGDGKYGTLQQPSAVDSDYFWRISEGLPWSAMPAWKLQYSEEDRWKLTHYIRVIFTQTEAPPQPPETGKDFVFPAIYKQLEIPETSSFERGKKLFLTNCAHCHGLAGDGSGWYGQYLNPKPADFREMAGKRADDELQGELAAKVTHGIKGSAMPSWGEFLPEAQRWDAVKYLLEAFIIGRPSTSSIEGSERIAAQFVTLSRDNWTGEGHTVSLENGALLYGNYCATCHGQNGQGEGPGTVGSASRHPRAFPKTMSESFIFWRIWDGVEDSTMYHFGWLLQESDIWDLTSFLLDMNDSQKGGEQ